MHKSQEEQKYWEVASGKPKDADENLGDIQVLFFLSI